MKLKDFYRMLFDIYGDLNWWPAQSPFEMAIGAILTQNTSWHNVEKAMENLKRYELISPSKILNIDENVLKSLIKPAGFYNQKCVRLKTFSKFIVERLDGDILKLKNYDLSTVRELLLGIKGVGKETADSIMLYGLDFKIFVIDAYTKRVFERFGFGKFEDYDSCQEFVHNEIKNESLSVFKNFHAVIVEHCKNFCKKKPKCAECPIKYSCKQNGLA